MPATIDILHSRSLLDKMVVLAYPGAHEKVSITLEASHHTIKNEWELY